MQHQYSVKKRQQRMTTWFGLVLLLCITRGQAAEFPIAIAIHGGAGTIERSKMTAEQEQQYRTVLTLAVETGYQLLAQGKTSQQAVVRAIQVLEQSPLFNAGIGAVYTFDGEHELDASLMEGKTLNAGAVAGVKTIKSPIAAAEQVMNNSVHVLLSGQGAEQFAKQQGLELVDNHYFDTDARYQALLEAKKRIVEQQAAGSEKSAYQALDVGYKYGTVGAVALDQQGNLAAGTSTGGMTAKRYGRIGDSPIIGAGTYANNASCAVSATGHGEYFIRYHVAADICARMQYQGISLQQAADTVVNNILVQAGGSGGVIALDRQGNIAIPFNSKGMYRASKRQGQATYVAIFADQ
jgi:L-asparaginase / beta-aspartyl-peptidase